MRIAAYYRVSSSQQRDRDTIAGQRAEVRSLVAARGWTLIAEYEDDGRSARSGLDKRRGLAAALEMVRGGAIDALVTVALDRLTRAENLRERFAIIGDMQEAAVLLVESGGARIDLGTFEGRLVAATKLELASEESAEKGRRTKRGRERAAREGRAPGRYPYGYRCERGAWSAPRGDVVLEIYEGSAAGVSCEALAGTLNRRGVPAARGRAWSGSTIADILRPRRPNGDPYVTGLWIGQRGEAAIPVPAIVPAELAQRARAALVGRAGRPPVSTRHVYLLDEGACLCGVCGAAVRARSCRGRLRRDGTRTVFRYYVCERRARAVAHGCEPCTLPPRSTAAVDTAVWAAVLARIDRPLVVGGAADHEARQGAETNDLLAAARRALAEEEARLAALADALGAGAVTADAYRIQVARIVERRDQSAARIAGWEAAEPTPAEPTRGALAALRMEVRRVADQPDARRALVRRLFPLWRLDATGLEPIRSGAAVGEPIPMPERIAV